jgi:hypothetical protein
MIENLALRLRKNGLYLIHWVSALPDVDSLWLSTRSKSILANPYTKSIVLTSDGRAEGTEVPGIDEEAIL